MPVPAPTLRPFPLPHDLPRHALLPRAVLAHAVAAVGHQQAADICRAYWPHDPATLSLVTRSATAPAVTSTAGWASELAQTALGGFLGSVQDSAAAALFAAGSRHDLSGVAQLSLPRASSTGGAAWSGEGSPIQIPQAVFAGATLGPVKRLAIIESCTREVAEASPEGGVAIISQLLRDAVTYQLDASLFSNTAGSTLRPPGVVAGITPSTASTATGISAAGSDLRTLTDAITLAGGSGTPLFFSSPGRAITLKGYFDALADRFYGSAAIPSGTLIAVDPRSFASAMSEPQILTSVQSSVHFEDTAPLQLTTGAQGSAVVATPVRNAFQQDLVLIRCVLHAGWCLRIPGAASWINTGLSW